MARPKGYLRRIRIARSIGRPDLNIKDQKHIEHADAQPMRDYQAWLRKMPTIPLGIKFREFKQIRPDQNPVAEAEILERAHRNAALQEERMRDTMRRYSIWASS